MSRLQAGFIFSELIVALGIFAVLVGLVTVSLLGGQHQNALSGAVDTLIGDLRQQQTQTMVGAGGYPGALSQGIYFESGRYTLFSGASFNPAEPTNQVINLPTGVVITTTLPNSSVVFAAGSGEFANFASGQNTVTLHEGNSGQQKSIQLNQLGVVTAIN